MKRFESEYDRWEREQALYDRASDSEKINIAATRNTKALLAELRVIRWLLVLLGILAVSAMTIWAPEGWWHQSFWK